MLRVLRKKVGTVYCRNNVTVPVCLIIEIPKVLLEKKTTKNYKKYKKTLFNDFKFINQFILFKDTLV